MSSAVHKCSWLVNLKALLSFLDPSSYSIKNAAAVLNCRCYLYLACKMSNLTTEHSAGQVTRNCAVASRGLRVYSS